MALTQQPFTPDGVTAMQQELDQLSPQDLQTQVSLIQSDLRTWVSDNFTLTSDQQTYLQNMDGNFLTYAGYLTGFAVFNGLPVSLAVAPNGSKPFKLVRIGDDITFSDSANGPSVTGGVSYNVEYQD